MNRTLRIVVFLATAVHLLSMFGERRCVYADQTARWQELIEAAERLAKDISFAKDRAVWPSDSAKYLARLSLTAIDSTTNQPDSARAIVLTYLGDYAMRDSLLADADSLWSSALQELERSPGTCQSLFREITMRKAILAREIGDFALHDSLLNEALSDSNAALALENRATLLHQLAGIYTKILRLQDNWRIHTQIANEWRANHRGDARAVIVAFMDLAEGASKFTMTNVPNAYQSQDSAIALAREAADIAENYCGETDSSMGYVLNRLGDYYTRRGDSRSADSVWNLAYKINLSALPQDHIECQGSIVRLGNIAAANGHYSQAERLLTLAVNLRRETQGPWHQEVASMLANLASLYREMGQFERAESLLVESLAIRKKALPENHPDLASSYSSIARICFDQGKFAAAESYWRDAYEIRAKVLGTGHAATASTMQNLARLYVSWGRLVDADSMLTRALVAKIRFLGTDNLELVTSYIDLAQLHLQMDQPNRSRKELDAAREVLALRGLEPNAELIMALADECIHESAWAKADSLLNLAESALSSDDSTLSYRLLRPLLKHADIFLATGDLGRADSLLQRAVQLANSSLQKRSATMEEVYFSLGRLRLAQNAFDSAEHWSRQALELAIENFHSAEPVLPEAVALDYSQRIHQIESQLLTIISSNQGKRKAGSNATGDNSEISWSTTEALVRCKAVVMQAMRQRQWQLQHSQSPAVQAMLDSLRDCKLQIARLFLSTDESASTGRLDRSLVSLSSVKDNLEDRLIHLGFRSGMTGDNAPSVQGIRSILTRNHKTIIECFKYRDGRTTQGANSRYATLVCSSNGARIYDLGPAEPIEKTIAEFTAHMKATAESERAADRDWFETYHTLAMKLRSMLWMPFARSIPDSGSLYVVSDAATNLIPFGVLTDESGRFLVERYQFAYLNNFSDLLERRPSRLSTVGLLAVGDPDFGVDDMLAERVGNDGEALYTNRSLASTVLRSVNRECRLRRDTAGRLAATKAEVEGVARIWRMASRDSVVLLTGAAATEGGVKELAASCRYIHVATHGYLLSDSCLPADCRAVTKTNPLLLSGLLLAAAGRTGFPSGADDGVLSSEEIAGLDLSSTECVVLSACESGLGVITDGDGVRGVSSAFRLAGAKTVISSLWSVPDQSTSRLMQMLYRNFGENVAAAVRAAQLAAISDLRAAQLPPHPWSWGAFIVTGN